MRRAEPGSVVPKEEPSDGPLSTGKETGTDVPSPVVGPLALGAEASTSQKGKGKELAVSQPGSAQPSSSPISASPTSTSSPGALAALKSLPSVYQFAPSRLAQVLNSSPGPSSPQSSATSSPSTLAPQPAPFLVQPVAEISSSPNSPATGAGAKKEAPAPFHFGFGRVAKAGEEIGKGRFAIRGQSTFLD